MWGWLAAAAVPSVSVLAALLAAGTGARRGLALGVALAGLALPWLVPPSLVWLRAVAGLAALTGVMKTVDLVRAPAAPPAARRALHPLTLADLRRERRVEPRFDGAAAGRLALYACVAGAGIGLLSLRVEAPAGWLARWVGGALLLYGLMDVVAAAFDLVHRALGWETGHLQNAPVLSRSVGELWGRRWNGPVSRWVAEHLFWPLARRGAPRLGLTAAFAWTALLHFYPTLVALGPRMALMMASFFVFQGVVVLAERPLRVPRWPRPAQHVWTATLLLLPAPLVLEPVLQAFGVAGP